MVAHIEAGMPIDGRDRAEMRRDKKVVPDSAKLLHEFVVLRRGWEMDNGAWVYEDGGKRFLVLTSHGTPYRAKTDELRELLTEHRQAVAGIERADYLLSEPIPPVSLTGERKVVPIIEALIGSDSPRDGG